MSFLPGLEPPRGDYRMREACRRCGGLTGRICHKSGQACVYCDCGEHVYNAPRSETEGRARIAKVDGRMATFGERRLEALLRLCESPIERTLCRELARVSKTLVAQHPIAFDGCSYRLDFAIPKLRIAIECDGHSFHERTPEQATYDRKRDRVLQTNGWLVLRFTTVEIEGDARRCAEDVARACETRLESLAR